jgi:hypothetical protein
MRKQNLMQVLCVMNKIVLSSWAILCYLDSEISKNAVNFLTSFILA